RSENEADAGADQEARDQHRHRADDVGPEKTEVVDERRTDLRRFREDVALGARGAKPDLDPADDQHGHRQNGERLPAGPNQARLRQRPAQGAPGRVRSLLEIRDALLQRLAHDRPPAEAGILRSIECFTSSARSANPAVSVRSMLRGRGNGTSKMRESRPGRGDSTATRSARKSASEMLCVTK